MRFKEKPQTQLYHGKQRIKERFLFFKKCINGECRWFEKTAWTEEYHYSVGVGYWTVIEWIV